jgi:hypothetical protein
VWSRHLHLHTCAAPLAPPATAGVSGVAVEILPILVLAFLQDFFDPDIPMAVRMRRLRSCLIGNLSKAFA